MVIQQVALLLVGAVAVVMGEWGYEGEAELPAQWANDNPACGNQKQSPIDIVCSDASFRRNDGPTITVVSQGSATLTNNAHSAQWSPGTGLITLQAPTLSSTYKLAQAHFHWGLKRNLGSEHAFDGTKASLEMHMVFYNPEFANLNAALADNKAEDVAVVGVLFAETTLDNVMLDPVTDNLNNIRVPNTTVNVPFMNFDGIDTSLVYEYTGSLTTPGCNEIVHWFVLPQLHSVGDLQMAAFRKMQFEDVSKMGNNFRPLQDLNGRTVSRNFKACRTRFIAEY